MLRGSVYAGFVAIRSQEWSDGRSGAAGPVRDPLGCFRGYMRWSAPGHLLRDGHNDRGCLSSDGAYIDVSDFPPPSTLSQ